MKTRPFTISIRINAIVSFSLNAISMEEAIAKAQEEIKTKGLLADDVEYIDGNEELVGVDADWNFQ